MKINVVYFAYLLPGKWESIVKEQLSMLFLSPLYREASTIYMSVISDETQLALLVRLLSSEYPKIKLSNVSSENQYEYLGIKTVYDVAMEEENDSIILYFHSKGMTSDTQRTRESLFTYTIDIYKKYVDAFEADKTLEIAGFLPAMCGFIYYNFFWVRSSYVKRHCVPPVPTDNRFYWEIWLTEGENKKHTRPVTFSPIVHSGFCDNIESFHHCMVSGLYSFLL